MVIDTTFNSSVDNSAFLPNAPINYQPKKKITTVLPNGKKFDQFGKPIEETPAYSGSSIVDYLSSIGKPSDYASRDKLAEGQGIKGYMGTAEQNTQMLNTLRGAAPATPAVPATPTSSLVGTGDEELTKQKAVEEKKLQDEIATQKKLVEDTAKANLDKIRSEIIPEGGKPTLDSERKFESLRTSQGVVPIETKINDIERQKADLQAQFDAFKRKSPEGVTQGFATGRISEEGQNIQDQLDALNREQTVQTNLLNTKNNYISTVMNLTKADYNAAVDKYNTTFSQNLQMQNTLQNYKTSADAEANRVRDDARAYLTSVSSMINTSGIKWDAISPSIKAQINSSEIAAGFASGTMESFAIAKPNAKPLAIKDGYDESGNAIATFLYDDGNGGIRTAIVKTGGMKSEDVKGGDVKSGEEIITTSGSIQDLIDTKSDITPEEVKALIDKQGKLTATSAQGLMDNVVFNYTDTQVDDFIERIKSEKGLDVTDKKGKIIEHISFNDIREAVNTGILRFNYDENNQANYKLSDSQKQKLLDSINKTEKDSSWWGLYDIYDKYIK